MTVFNFISLFGGLALFLFGMRLMSRGLEQSSSGALKHAMGKLTTNPVGAFFLGMGATAAIQSSTATIVLTVGLVGAGVLAFEHTIGIVLGANVGTAVTSQIIRLMLELQTEMNLSYLFISHDMSVVRYMADRVGVMYLGRLVEEASTDELFEHPLHPYTQVLLSAVPTPDPRTHRERIILEGDLPSPLNPPPGCPFHTRCPRAAEGCMRSAPAEKEAAPGHRVSCHLA